MAPDRCGQVTKTWWSQQGAVQTTYGPTFRTDGGAAREWHHESACAWCNGTGEYSYHAACSCGHWADDCPEAREVVAEEPKARFEQSPLFELEAAS